MNFANRISIIADDFTGAMDTAVFFSQYFKTSFYLNQSNNDSSNIEVEVINTNTRNNEIQEFITAIKPRLNIIRDSKWKFKKIDSTLRGQIGSEIEILLNLLELETALIIPSCPKTNRTVKNGVLYINKVPLHLTDLTEDFTYQIQNSNIQEIIANQTDALVGLIPCNILQLGIERIMEEILIMKKDGVKFICFDAVEEKHIEQIINAVSKFDEFGNRFLWVGAAGLGKSICKRFLSEGVTSNSVLESNKKVELYNDKILVLNGSKKDLSHEQLEEICRRFSLNKIVILESEEQIDESLFLNCENYVVTVPREHKKSWNHSLTEELAKCVKQINEKQNISRMILIGGDTAWEVIKSLQTEKIDIIGEIEPSVPYGILYLKNNQKILFASKGGRIGEKEALIRVYKFLKSY